jgi:hypothetical protein
MLNTNIQKVPTIDAEHQHPKSTLSHGHHEGPHLPHYCCNIKKHCKQTEWGQQGPQLNLTMRDQKRPKQNLNNFK